MRLAGSSSPSSALPLPLFLNFPSSGLDGADPEEPFGTSCTSRKEIRWEVFPANVIDRLLLSASVIRRRKK
jgi:hypothetical protein